MHIRTLALAVVLGAAGCTGSGDGEGQLTPVATLDPAVHEAATRLAEAGGDLSKVPMFQQVIECIAGADAGTAPGQVAEDLISEWRAAGRQGSLLTISQDACKDAEG